MMNEELPLFPLSTILLPGAHVPLHIFEERYRRLVASCLERATSFGIVLIAEGEEVGGPASPYGVGTEAHIVGVERLSDGRFNLLVRGGRRFRIEGLNVVGDLFLSRVRWVAEVEGPGASALRPTVHHLLGEYLRRLNLIPGEQKRLAWVAQDPTAFSYTVADLLNVDPHLKQMLLEAPSTEERLRGEAGIIMQSLAAWSSGAAN